MTPSTQASAQSFSFGKLPCVCALVAQWSFTVSNHYNSHEAGSRKARDMKGSTHGPATSGTHGLSQDRSGSTERKSPEEFLESLEKGAYLADPAPRSANTSFGDCVPLRGGLAGAMAAAGQPPENVARAMGSPPQTVPANTRRPPAEVLDPSKFRSKMKVLPLRLPLPRLSLTLAVCTCCALTGTGGDREFVFVNAP